MNAHLYAYLKQQAIAILPSYDVDTRAARRAHVLKAVEQFPEQHRGFIADFAWSLLGYGGGI